MEFFLSKGENGKLPKIDSNTDFLQIILPDPLPQVSCFKDLQIKACEVT